MKKNKDIICKRIFFIILIIFINFNLFAQKPFYKKGNWGVDFGANYYCPIIDKYPFLIKSYDNCSYYYYSIEPIGGFGKYIGLFRTIKLNKTDDKNLFNALIGLSYNQRLSKIKYKCINYIQKDGIIECKRGYFSLDIKLNSIVNIKEKYEIYNAVGFRTNLSIYIFNSIYTPPPYQEYYLTYSLGFLFYLEETSIMPYVDFEIIDFRKKYGEPFIDLPYRKEYYNLINFGISIFFNKPLKNKKNEEK